MWDGDTFLSSSSSLISASSSEPTVWDGDPIGQKLSPRSLDGSEPTVWDGDRLTLAYFEDTNQRVPSPLCGMETQIPMR